MKAKEFDKRFDAGQDISKYLALRRFNMRSWVNIHHPTPIADSPTDHNKLYLQEKNQGRIGQIHIGDIVFIYETGGLVATL